MRESFHSGSIPFLKAYLQSLIDVIEVDDTQIHIKGSKDVLERAVLAGRNLAIPGSQMSNKWRVLRDSNSCPQIRGLGRIIEIVEARYCKNARNRPTKANIWC
jgi:hypothetical protein